jgi:hypothetical protein
MSASLRWNLPLVLLLAACSQAPVASEPVVSPPLASEPAPAPAEPAPEARNEPVMCTDPRPELCTMIYAPVCATRDTGIRCITTPCPSTEQVTRSSACNACSDPKVISHVKGECPAK